MSPEDNEMASLLARYKREKAALRDVLTENGVPASETSRLSFEQMKERAAVLGVFWSGEKQ